MAEEKRGSKAEKESRGIGPITKLMLKQHAFVNKLLINFEKVPANKKNRARDIFSDFRWNLEKHFFIEERSIFGVVNQEDDDEVILMNRLLQDHKDLMTILNNLTEELMDGKIPKTYVFKELLFAHEGREIKIFYPKLDKVLPETEKKYIIEKIGDIKLR